MFQEYSSAAVLRKAVRCGLVAAVLPLAACGGGAISNKSVESVHQPVVSYSTFVYDVRTNGGYGLSGAEAERLSGWLDALDAGYGDKIAIVTGGAAVPLNMQKDIAGLVTRRGLVPGAAADAAGGVPRPGFVRLVLRRARASVPGCPDWRSSSEGNMTGGTSSNFGCGVMSSLAGMIADPEDLVRGVSTDSILRTDTSTRAIETYRQKSPTGAGALQSISAGGQ